MSRAPSGSVCSRRALPRRSPPLAAAAPPPSAALILPSAALHLISLDDLSTAAARRPLLCRVGGVPDICPARAPAESTYLRYIVIRPGARVIRLPWRALAVEWSSRTHCGRRSRHRVAPLSPTDKSFTFRGSCSCRSNIFEETSSREHLRGNMNGHRGCRRCRSVPTMWLLRVPGGGRICVPAFVVSRWRHYSPTDKPERKI